MTCILRDYQHFEVLSRLEQPLRACALLMESTEPSVINGIFSVTILAILEGREAQGHRGAHGNVDNARYVTIIALSVTCTDSSRPFFQGRFGSGDRDNPRSRVFTEQCPLR